MAATIRPSRIWSRARSADFAENSVLLDFTAGPRQSRRRPISAPRFARSAVSTMRSSPSSEVPSRSLLSRLTDHYLQIIANRAPIGFEAEFVNQRGDADLLSRHPDAVLVRRRHDRFHLRRHQLETWRRRCVHPGSSPGSGGTSAPFARMSMTMSWFSKTSSCRPPGRSADRRDSGRAGRCVDEDDDDSQSQSRPSTSHGKTARSTIRSPTSRSPEIPLDADAGLADRLWAARETADAVKAADGRSRSALYRALVACLSTSHWLPSGSRRIMPSCSRNRA